MRVRKPWSKDQKKGRLEGSRCIANNLADSSKISISGATKNRLERLGRMTDNFDSLLIRILDHIDTCDKWWDEQN